MKNGVKVWMILILISLLQGADTVGPCTEIRLHDGPFCKMDQEIGIAMGMSIAMSAVFIAIRVSILVG